MIVTDQISYNIILPGHHGGDVVHHGLCLGPGQVGAHHNGLVFCSHIILITMSSNTREMIKNSVQSQPAERKKSLVTFGLFLPVGLGHPADYVVHLDHHLHLLRSLVGVLQYQHKLLQGTPGNKGILQLSRSLKNA